jgi:hypothetical protein
MGRIEVVEGCAKDEHTSCRLLSICNDSIGKICDPKGVNAALALTAPDRTCDSIQFEDGGVFIYGFNWGSFRISSSGFIFLSLFAISMPDSWMEGNS